MIANTRVTQKQFPKHLWLGSATTLNPDETHFHMAPAESIFTHGTHVEFVEDDGLIWLDITQYSTYDQQALEWLASALPEAMSLRIGFRLLAVAAAETLSTIACSFFELTNLHELDADVAAHLHRNQECRPIRDMWIETPVGAAVIANLLPQNVDTPLGLSLPSLSDTEAHALVAHNHELSLKVRNAPLSHSAAQILSNHTGYHLSLEVLENLTPELWEGLESNPAKVFQKYVRKDDRSCIYLLENIGFVSSVQPAHQ